MDREELKAAIAAVKSPTRDRQTIYGAMDALGISYKRTNCGKCLRDYLAIVREELGIIDSAAEESGFDGATAGGRYTYLKKDATLWKGVIYDAYTDERLIEEFVRHFDGFYRLNETITDN